MDLYSIVLFVHIVGALLLFVLLTVEGVGLRAGFVTASLNRVLGPISALASSFGSFATVASPACGLAAGHSNSRTPTTPISTTRRRSLSPSIGSARRVIG